MSVESQLEQVRSEIEQVRSKFSEEQITSVGPTLKGIENAVVSLTNDLIAANKESAKRKTSINLLTGEKEELSSEKEVWKTEKKALEEKINDPANTEKITALETFKTGVLQKQRSKFISSFDAISKHANWANAQSLYKIPTEMEKKTVDGKEIDVLKWDTIDENQMEQNINKLDEHNIVNLFGESSKPTPGHRKGDTADHEHEAPKTAKEASDNLEKYRAEQGA